MMERAGACSGYSSTLPHTRMEGSVDIKVSEWAIVAIAGKRFGKEVCKIVLGGDPLNADGAGLYEFTNVVVSDVNVLDLAMIFRILC